MKRLAWLTLTLVLASCSTNGSALDPGTGGSGGGGDSTGGSGGAGRGHPDGSIEVTGGTGGDGTGGVPTGGTGGAMGGTGGAMGGTGGSVTPDAGAPDAGTTDAANMCQACAAFATEYANGIRKEQACNPAVPNQCLKQTPGQLTCGCPVWVTTTVLSDDVRMRYQAAGCLKCFGLIACPAIACVNPGTGACVPVMAAGDPAIAVPVPPLPMGQCMSKF
jgi:hypothetical protein